jgi:hypothetical protein
VLTSVLRVQVLGGRTVFGAGCCPSIRKEETRLANCNFCCADRVLSVNPLSSLNPLHFDPAGVFVVIILSIRSIRRNNSAASFHTEIHQHPDRD